MNQLAKRFPTIYMVFTQFKNGSLQLIKDARTRITLSPQAGQTYTPEQLIAHHEFSSDIGRCLPLFIVFWIPIIGQWIALPIAFFFPGQTLSRQFWTDPQREKVLDNALKLRMSAYPRLAEKLLVSIDSAQVDEKLAQLGSDTVESIHNGKPLEQAESKLLHRLFSEADNLQLHRLSGSHKKYLSASWLLGPFSDLHRQAVHLVNLDESLKHFQLRNQPKHILDMVCHQRGFSLTNRSATECHEYVNQWLKLSHSQFSQGAELGYLLHLPMLMKNNWPKYESSYKEKGEPG